MPLFRCTNEPCADNLKGPPAHDFEAADPVCPKCGADRRTAPTVVVERATIHYLVSTPAGPIRTPNGRRQVACRPALASLPEHASGERAAVTCPDCKQSAVYAAHESAGVDQHQDIVKFTPTPA